MKLSEKVATGAVLVIVLLVVLFQVYAEIVPEAQDAGAGMNDTVTCEAAGGVYCTNLSSPYCYDACTNQTNATAVTYNSIPLNGLVNSTGVVFILVMAFLVVLVVTSLLRKTK